MAIPRRCRSKCHLHPCIGVSRLVKMVEDGSVELLKFGLLLTLIQLLSSRAGLLRKSLLMASSFAYKAAFQPVVLVLCSILAFFIVLLGIVLLGGKIACKGLCRAAADCHL